VRQRGSALGSTTTSASGLATCEALLGSAAEEKLAALASNRDPREIKPHRRARSAGAQSTIGGKPAEERVFRPTLLHLADRIGTRLRAKSRPGRTVTVRVRFGGGGQPVSISSVSKPRPAHRSQDGSPRKTLAGSPPSKKPSVPGWRKAKV